MLLHVAHRKILACSGNTLYNIIHTAEKRDLLWLYAILRWWLGTGAILPLAY
jgi:hypothetical protein